MTPHDNARDQWLADEIARAEAQDRAAREAAAARRAREMNAELPEYARYIMQMKGMCE